MTLLLHNLATINITSNNHSAGNGYMILRRYLGSTSSHLRKSDIPILLYAPHVLSRRASYPLASPADLLKVFIPFTISDAQGLLYWLTNLHPFLTLERTSCYMICSAHLKQTQRAVQCRCTKSLCVWTRCEAQIIDIWWAWGWEQAVQVYWCLVTRCCSVDTKIRMHSGTSHV